MDLSFFFFSSRRRHTRCSRDWSSDVCSSDLGESAYLKFARKWIRTCPRQLAAFRRNLSQYHSIAPRSEEHTSELQSRLHLVCRLLLEKKKKYIAHVMYTHYNR